MHLFTWLEEARAIIEEWRVDYSECRPPTEFAAARPQGPSALPRCGAPAQPALAHAA
ncbi:MAG: hypothetical protein JXQ99_08485 [Hyphomicrobiaceae bacterium]